MLEGGEWRVQSGGFRVQDLGHRFQGELLSVEGEGVPRRARIEGS